MKTAFALVYSQDKLGCTTKFIVETGSSTPTTYKDPQVALKAAQETANYYNMPIGVIPLVFPE